MQMKIVTSTIDGREDHRIPGIEEGSSRRTRTG
jgi:hypothetical protein